MAETGTRTPKSSAWPWIIGALVLALVIWGITTWFDPGPREANRMGTEQDVQPGAELQRPMPPAAGVDTLAPDSTPDAP